MSSVPGPIISFRISQPELAGAVQPALQQIRSQSQTVSNQIAEDWRRMAAQIRASMAQGLSTDKETLGLRTQLIGVLDRQISGYRQLNELSTKELSSLKAITLERERQANAIKTGTVGVTAGTTAALGQVSTQTVLGIGRILDSLVNRYLGGAAGAAFRTVRDVGYYSSIASGATGTGAAGGAGILGGISSLTSVIPEAVLAVGGLGAVEATLAATMAVVTKGLIDQAQAVNNVAASTGLSTTQVQIYTRLAKEMDLDAGSLTNAFARLQSQIGEYITKGKSADESTQNFIRVLTQFGISVKDNQGHIRNISDILSDFSNVVQALPDKNAAAALTLEAFGTRGKILADVMNQATNEGKSFKEVLDSIGGSGLIIQDAQIQNLQKAKNLWDELWRSAAGQAVGLREGIAQAFLNGTGIQEILNTAAGPQDARAKAVAALRSNRTPLSAGESLFVGDPEKAKAQIDAILKGDERAAQIEDLRKQASEELAHGNYLVAEQLANQVASLKAAVDLERQRSEEQKRLAQFLLNPGTGSLASGREARSVQDLIGRLLNPGQGGAPDIGVGINTTTDYLKGIVGPAAKAPLNGFDILQQINKEHEDLFKTQREIDAEHYQDELDTLNEALKKQLISQQEYNAAAIKLNQDRNKTLEDANKKYDDEAGKLFDDLISGHTQNFTKALLKDVEDIATGPVKKLFESLVGGQLQSLSDIFSGKKSAGGAPGGSGSLKDVWNTIKSLWTGKTPGFFPGDTGSSPGGGAGSAGQASVGTMDVRAGVVNIYSLGVASTGGSLGNFFGANSLLGGFGNFFGNLNPFGGSGSQSSGGGGVASASASTSALSRVLNAVNPFAAGAATLGIGLATGNEAAMAIGAAALASKASLLLSGSIQGLPAGVTSALGTLGNALPGIGIGAAGIISADQSRTTAGKIGGTLEAGLGGALAGTAILPGIGTAVGAVVGLIGGTLASIFGGGPQGFQQSVAAAMSNQQYHAPLSENFSFASNGSIANTLGTGFFQSGSQFSQYALPANTPFYASALTGRLTWQQLYQLQNSGLNPNAPFLGNPSTNPYIGQGPVGVHATNSSGPAVQVHFNLPGFIDAAGATNALAPHIATITQMISKQLSNSSSGFGSSARRAVFLP